MQPVDVPPVRPKPTRRARPRASYRVVNDCCYGVPWIGPWAVTFPSEGFAYRDQMARGLLSAGAPASVALHPVQLYTATLMFLMCQLLVRMIFRPHRDGAVFFTFLLAYGALRLAMAGEHDGVPSAPSALAPSVCSPRGRPLAS